MDRGAFILREIRARRIHIPRLVYSVSPLCLFLSSKLASPALPATSTLQLFKGEIQHAPQWLQIG